MGYEIFTRKVIRAGSPTVAISKSGKIALNKSSTVTLERNAVEFVLLLWDKDRRKIGIRPITKKDARAYRLKYGPKNNGAYFSAKTFFDYIGVDYSETRSFPAVWAEDESLLEAEVPTEFMKDEKQQRLIEMGLGPKRNAKTG
jgi:hypothetical protein